MRHLRFDMLACAAAVLFAAGAAQAQPKPVSLEVALGDVSLNKVAFLVAADSGIYARNGLSVHQYITPYAADKARHARVNVPAQYVKDDEKDDSDIMVGGGTPMIVGATRDARAADRVIIASFEPKVRDHIISLASIRSPTDLKGKRLGYSDDGAVTHMTAIMFSKRMGWNPNDDLSLIGHGNALDAVKEGKVDAFIGSALLRARAREDGLKDLVDLGTYDMPVAGSGLNAERKWLAVNRDAAARFVKSSVEAIALIKTDKQVFAKALAKWFNITDSATQDGLYRQVADLPKKPYPAVDGIKRTMETYNYREMKQHKAEDFYDVSFVTALDKTGYIDSLYDPKVRADHAKKD